MKASFLERQFGSKLEKAFKHFVSFVQTSPSDLPAKGLFGQAGSRRDLCARRKRRDLWPDSEAACFGFGTMGSAGPRAGSQQEAWTFCRVRSGALFSAECGSTPALSMYTLIRLY